MKHTVHMRDREMGKVGIMLMVQGGVLGKLRHSAACLHKSSEDGLGKP